MSAYVVRIRMSRISMLGIYTHTCTHGETYVRQLQETAINTGPRDASFSYALFVICAPSLQSYIHNTYVCMYVYIYVHMKTHRFPKCVSAYVGLNSGR